jgi:hypothetical protein
MIPFVHIRSLFTAAAVAMGFLVCVSTASAQVGGSLSGTVKDPSGAVVPGVSVTATNTVLGTEFNAVTDGQGLYAFPKLPVGRYDVTMLLDGFKPQKRTGIQVDADSALQINATLEIGDQSETVTVSVNAVRVDTVSTQLGEVVPSQTMTSLSLNGRSYTDLLSIQPGVIPTTTIQSNSVIMAGVTGPVAPSGGLNPGIVSVSGQRETANGFYVNGSDVQERMNGGTGVVPNLDSIEEFRLLTNNFDPEYGNYNGGIVNVVTKSGSDMLRGNLFEFFRNTNLDARNYFSPERAEFKQNQPGGTVGGPLKRGKVFFFGDYQATRTTQGIETGNISVPSILNRGGNFSDIAGDLDGAVNGPFFANVLSKRLGYAVRSGEPYYTSACQTTAQCVFPGAIIPQRAWSSPAQKLLQYVPSPNRDANTLSTGAFEQTVRDDKGSFRVDGNTRWLGLLTGYYFLDDYTLDNPYPGQQGGASVPGFDAQTIGRAQLWSFGSAKTLGQNTVNDFHASLTHNHNNVGVPHGGAGVSLASQGFVTGAGTPGIVVLAPQFEGVENMVFNTFTMGVTITGVNQTGDTLHVSDSISRVLGSHTVKFGGQYQFQQVRLEPNATFNGTFTFAGTETGSDFADFLIGAPSNYIQSSGGVFYLRNQYGGVFAQDSWRAKSNLTINYGVRWDIMAPWYEKDNQIQTIVPGQQSAVYPGAPLGLVFPGDTGISRGLSPTRFGNVSPRVGVAYSPNEKTSVRASYGLFYNAFQGLSAGIMYGVPPYGYNYLSPAPPLFDQPFITAADGTNNGQRFPQQFPAFGASPGRPINNIDWAQFLPVNADPYFGADNRTPYSANFMFSVQRELASNMVATASYVGTRGHNMLVLQQTNPGDPALCLSVSQESQVAPGSATCGPFGENGVYTRRDGTVINATRTALGADYGTVTKQTSIGYSRYNGLELNLHYTKGAASILAGYTLSKSVDVSSNLGEQVDPFDVAKSEAPSAFDMRHNFVVSYSYDLPFEQVFNAHNQLAGGWSLSGTTRLSSGFPVTLYDPTDTSLLGTFGNGVNNNLVDTPNYAAGCDLKINHDPAKGPGFNKDCFSLAPLGQRGNAPRRMFYGPGITNFDLALIKRVRLDDRRNLELRLEAFNVFNHPQFYGAGAVDGNIVSPTFGEIESAAAPRFIQIAAKFNF